MLRSKLLIRLDDASKNMDMGKWILFEEIFLKYNILPIMAVVPNNLDLGISYSNDLKDFWDIIRRWQSYGWTIAMHGYSHELHSTTTKTIVDINKYGEFGELDFTIQETKIKLSLEMFKENNINVDMWVAPAHNFDLNTLKALSNNTDIRLISDGISLDTFCEYGFYWIPQQLWRFKFSLFGVRTICLHPNDMSFNDIALFEKKILIYHKYISTVGEITYHNRSKTIFDKIYEFLFFFKRNLYYKLRKLNFLLF